MTTDLYRIDDVLFRAGRWTLALWLCAVAVLAFMGAAETAERIASWGDVALTLVPHAVPLTLSALCPIALFATGLTMRRREERVISLWFLLQQQAEVSVAELIANSHFTRQGIERAVLLINTKGLGYYVWDRKTDVIQDGRLEREFLHVEKCDGCSAEISLEIPATSRKIPRCPYCEDPISLEHLTELRREALDRLRAKPRGEALETADGSFSIVLFLVLLLFFWPAAIVYGWLKWEHIAARVH